MNKLTTTRREMVEAGGRLCQILGLPRSTGQIYGLLYLSPQPLSLNDIVDVLGISKGSASTGTRQLASWGAVKQVWVQGDRRDFYEVLADLGTLLQGGFNDYFKTRLHSSQSRINGMELSLQEELESGDVTKEDYKFCLQRITQLTRLHRKIKLLTPLAEKLMK